MPNPYEPPTPGVLSQREVPTQSGVVGKMLSLLFAALGALGGLIGIVNLVTELSGDGVDVEDALVAVILLSTLPSWLLASRDFWRGRRRAWLFVVIPLSVFLAAAVVVAVREPSAPAAMAGLLSRANTALPPAVV